MDEAFTKLEKDGKNDVDNLMKWMKDSKVIDGTKEQEDKARDLFKEVPNPKNVPLDKFKEIVQKLAVELKKSMADVTKMLGEEGPKMLQAVLAGGGGGGLGGALGGAATSALKGAFSKK